MVQSLGRIAENSAYYDITESGFCPPVDEPGARCDVVQNESPRFKPAPAPPISRRLHRMSRGGASQSFEI
jgi:hypothetical protein